MNPSEETNQIISGLAQAVATLIATHSQETPPSGRAVMSVWIKPDNALGITILRSEEGSTSTIPLPLSQELVDLLASLYAHRASQVPIWSTLRMNVNLTGAGKIDFEIYYDYESAA